MFIVNNLNAQLNIVSWNIKDFGKSRDDLEIEMIANIVRDADIIAIQEVVAKDPGGAKAVARLADELNRKGANWSYAISDPTKSPSSHKCERYAFLWKEHKAILKSKARLISNLEQYVDREPYYAVFDIDGKELNILNFHSCKYNENPDEEINYIYQILSANPQPNWVLAGDFNLTEDHEVFNQYYDHGFDVALDDQATTLKMKCASGNYLNHAIDNIYYKLSDFEVYKSGVLDFIDSCKSVPIKRTSISDHLPVIAKLN